MGRCGLGHGLLARFYERGNETSASVKDGEVFHLLSDYQLLEEDSAARR